MSNSEKKYDETSKVRATDYYGLMNSSSEYARAKWAEKLGVSTSGYYTWLHARKRRQAVENTRRGKIIAAFTEGQGVYGADRICGILRHNGDSVPYPVVK